MYHLISKKFIICLAVITFISVTLARFAWYAEVITELPHFPPQNSDQILNKTAVAVCVAGLVREFDGPVLPDMFEHHVLRPLSKLYRLYIIFAVDHEPQRGLRRTLRYGNVSVKIQNASNIAQRHAACLEEIRHASSTHNIAWVIITRPDMAYFEDAPRLSTLLPGIHMRARVLKSSTNLTVYQSFLSYHWWHYVANTSVTRSLTCQTALNTSNSEDCVTFDDQLAIMDILRAEAYLSPGTHRSPSAPSSTFECRACATDIKGGYGVITASAEYQLSKRLASAHVPLHLLSWTTRLGRYICQLEGQHNVLSKIP